MFESSFVAAQLAASQEGLSSMRLENQWVMLRCINNCHLLREDPVPWEQLGNYVLKCIISGQIC
jgi:hypothetical protein